MKIRLQGYFDNNLGDDLMQDIFVDNMPEHQFYVSYSQQEFIMHLKNKGNVCIGNESEKTDVAVNVIGTGFRYSSKTNILSKLVSDFCKKRKPYNTMAVIDCSIDPPKYKLEKAIVKYELAKYDYISCRDVTSEEMIKEYVDKCIIRRHEDIVFALDKNRIYKNTGEGCLGVVVVQRNYSRENYMYYREIAATCDKYIEKTGKRVLLFAFDTGIENDTLAALCVQALIKNKANTEIIMYNSDVDYILKNYARCDRIVSSRFHGVVLSLVANIPVIAVSDRLKIDLLSQKYGFEVLSKSTLSHKELYEKISCLKDTVVIPDEVYDDAKMHIEEFREFLKSGDFN